MRTTLLATILAAIAVLTIAGFASAANPVNIQIMAVEEQPGHMLLTVSAVDEKGKPFPGLGASSFNAWINDQPLIVRGVQAETARLPASVLLLVDVSGSMAGEPMNQSRAAIQQFIDTLDPQDQVAVMSFANNVQLLQDFTTDRGALGAAVNRLIPVGETALYDGVIQAAEKMAAAPQGRKLIVLLSDGSATIGVGNRARSIQATQASSVGVVAFGLGTGIDKKYLTDLAAASGGRFLEASTPAAIKQAYADLASAIRSQYTLQVDVPRSIDRTVPGRLKVHVIYRADNAYAERGLDAVQGALPPPFAMTLTGLKPGDKPNSVVSLKPAVQQGIEVVKLDYYVDDKVIHTTDGAAAGFDLDASTLGTGSHVLKIVATDAAGREGEVQVPFIVPEVAVTGGGTSIPVVPLAALAVLLLLGYVGHKFLWKRILLIYRGGDTYETRVSSWASIRSTGAVQRPEEWPDRPETPAAAVATEDAVRGRVVIMDEAAVRGGELDSIREFEMRSSPLTFGSGPSADMRVGDAGGLIAAEEARVWIQRGRLVYHKLTTLSAMATEGVTAGWQFLEDGDEMRIGPYRLIFQAQMQEEVTEEVVLTPDRLPQEHGMALRPTGTDDAGNRGFQSWTSDTPAPEEEMPKPVSLHDFNTPGQDGSARTWGTDVLERGAPAWGSSPEPDAAIWGASSDDEDDPPSWESPDGEEQDSLPTGSEPGVEWGVLEMEHPEDDPAVDAQDQPPHSWSFTEQTTASEWGSDTPEAADYEWNTTDLPANGVDSDNEEPQALTWQPEAWLTSTQSGAGEADEAAGEQDMESGDDDDAGHHAWGT